MSPMVGSGGVAKYERAAGVGCVDVRAVGSFGLVVWVGVEDPERPGGELEALHFLGGLDGGPEQGLEGTGGLGLGLGDCHCELGFV